MRVGDDARCPLLRTFFCIVVSLKGLNNESHEGCLVPGTVLPHCILIDCLVVCLRRDLS